MKHIPYWEKYLLQESIYLVANPNYYVYFFIYYFLFVSTLLHEYTHATAAILLGYRDVEVKLNWFNRKKNAYCYVGGFIDLKSFRIMVLAPFILETIIAIVFIMIGVYLPFSLFLLGLTITGALSDINMFVKSVKYPGTFYQFIKSDPGKCEVFS